MGSRCKVLQKWFVLRSKHCMASLWFGGPIGATLCVADARYQGGHSSIHNVYLLTLCTVCAICTYSVYYTVCTVCKDPTGCTYLLTVVQYVKYVQYLHTHVLTYVLMYLTST